MARITSIGMPRKSFVPSAAEEMNGPEPEAGPSMPGEEEKKKTHRGGGKKYRKALLRAEQGEGTATATARATGSNETEVLGAAGGESRGKGKKDKLKKRSREDRDAGERSWGRDPSIAKRSKLSEDHSAARRLKRQDEKHSGTTCFACRSVGHAAKDCPNVLLASEKDHGFGEGSAGGGQGKVGGKRGKGKVGGEVAGGKCYRCNGSDHSLSFCPVPLNPSNPTPYATCFICLGSGHLSSLCPQNHGRGVYPKGGSCKVCGSVAHRAKDCPDDKRGRAGDEDADEERRGRKEVVLGSGNGAGGADEDDFMVVQREAGKDGTREGKKRKVNNNGVRGKYQPGERAAMGEEGTAGGSARTGANAQPVVRRDKVKAKVVAF